MRGKLIKKLIEDTKPTASSSIPANTELITPNKGIGANTSKHNTGFKKAGRGKKKKQRNNSKPENFGFAVSFLQAEIQRAQALGATQITLHPGAHVGAGPEAGIKQIIKGLNEVLEKGQTAQIALETMAGKGTEIGRSFEEIAAIIDGVTLNEKLSVTFDTCHTNDAGYNVKEDFDGVLNEFDKVIGLERLKVIHVNDSKNPQGSHKDRHANIGFGTIGFEALNKIVHHEQLKQLPKILETPYVGEDKKNKKAPYGFEIAMLQQQTFDPDLLTKIMEQ